LAAKLENLSVQLADSKAASFLQTHTHGKKKKATYFLFFITDAHNECDQPEMILHENFTFLCFRGYFDIYGYNRTNGFTSSLFSQ